MRAMYDTGYNFSRSATILVLAVFSTTLPLRCAVADADGERQALVRLAHELETLEPLIRTAESQANPDARIRFRYDWLRQDLDRVQRGIREHIDAPRAEPRTFAPLRADYRR